MKQTVIIDEKEYTVATITAAVSKSFPTEFANPRDSTFLLLIESLRAGGDADAEETVTNLEDGFFDKDSPYKRLVALAMKSNGYKETPKASGEETAGAGPALVEQTGLSSTEDSPVVSDGDTAT